MLFFCRETNPASGVQGAPGGGDLGSRGSEIKEEHSSDSLSGQTKLETPSPSQQPNIYTDLQKASTLAGGGAPYSSLMPGSGQMGLNNGPTQDVGSMLSEYQTL